MGVWGVLSSRSPPDAEYNLQFVKGNFRSVLHFFSATLYHWVEPEVADALIFVLTAFSSRLFDSIHVKVICNSNMYFEQKINVDSYY
jgi:hypothetical protein